MFLQPLLQWKSNKYYKFCVCVCSLSYTACIAHVPYCHLWPAMLYGIFIHYLIRGMIFKRSYRTQNVCFDFLFLAVSNTLVSSAYVTGLAVWYIPYWRSFISCQITSVSAQKVFKHVVNDLGLSICLSRSYISHFLTQKGQLLRILNYLNSNTCIAKVYGSRTNLYL